MPHIHKGGKDYTSKPGRFLQYKDRWYTWCGISECGTIVLIEDMLAFLKIEAGMKLLSIRSSNIAFTMGAYCPLVDESIKHEDNIPLYRRYIRT